MAGSAESSMAGGSGAHGWLSAVTRTLAVLFSLFHIYTATFGALPNLRQRAVHVAFAVSLALLSSAERRRTRTGQVFDLSGAVLIWVVAGYIIVEWYRIMTAVAEIRTADLVLGIATTALLLDVCRRLVGWSLTLVAGALVLYALAGHRFPGFLQHAGLDWQYVIDRLFLSTQGIWGAVTGVSAKEVAIFIIFGTALLESGASDTIKNIGLWTVGGAAGGASKLAVLSSGLVGMISGSATANVAVTGSYTIPLQRRLGYSAEQAAASEAVASTGGQLVPPIMGAGAFLIAEFLGVPYSRVALAGILPAIAFYGSAYWMVDRYSRRIGLEALAAEDIPRARDAFRLLPLAQLVIPVSVILVLLLRGYPTEYSGAVGLGLLAGLTFLRHVVEGRGVGAYGRFIMGTLEGGGRDLTLIAIIVATAQIAIGMIGMTGLGSVLGLALQDLGGDSPWLSLVLAMVLAIVMGMGAPTAAAYVLTISVVGPALTLLGFEGLPIHMFVFYFAVLSAITPPVCAAVYVAASMAQANWVKTALLSCRFSLAGLVVPYYFMVDPVLLWQPTSVSDAIASLLALAAALAALGGAASGYFLRRNHLAESAVLAVGGLVSIWLRVVTGSAWAAAWEAALLMLAVGVWQLVRSSPRRQMT